MTIDEILNEYEQLEKGYEQMRTLAYLAASAHDEQCRELDKLRKENQRLKAQVARHKTQQSKPQKPLQMPKKYKDLQEKLDLYTKVLNTSAVFIGSVTQSGVNYDVFDDRTATVTNETGTHRVHRLLCFNEHGMGRVIYRNMSDWSVMDVTVCTNNPKKPFYYGAALRGYVEEYFKKCEKQYRSK